MDIEPLIPLIRLLAGDLEAQLRSRPELRESVAKLAAWLQELSDRTSPTLLSEAAAAPVETLSRSTPPVAEPAPAPALSAPTQPAGFPLPPATHIIQIPRRTERIRMNLGDATGEIEVTGSVEELAAARLAARPPNGHAGSETSDDPTTAPAPPDLALVAKRSRLKAEAYRHELARRVGRFTPQPDAYWHKRHDLIAQARAVPDGYVFAFDQKATNATPETLEMLAQCHDNLAMAAELVHDLDGARATERELEVPAVQLLAEAQSAVRAALPLVGSPFDSDQEDTFYWLRDKTARDRILVHRYMRLNDTPDPHAWEDLHARLAAMRAQLDDIRQRARQDKNALGRVRYHAKRLADGARDDAPGHWAKVYEGIAAALDTGLLPSDPRLREILLPALEASPERPDAPEPAQRVLDELDRYLDAQVPAEPEPAKERAVSDEVRAAAALLRGRSAVLIGGTCRPQQRESLERGLGLAELRWLTSRDHQSTAPFEPEVARPETALVMVMIRFSSHSFAPNVREMCRRHGKIMVRLTHGYGINQVAHQILEQASEQLADLAPTGAR